MPLAIAIGISTVTTEFSGGGVAPVISTGFLLENGTDLILLENGDYLLQE